VWPTVWLSPDWHLFRASPDRHLFSTVHLTLHERQPEGFCHIYLLRLSRQRG